MRIVLTYEMSNGDEGIREFDDITLAYRWIHSQGDHLIDYAIYYS